MSTGMSFSSTEYGVRVPGGEVLDPTGDRGERDERLGRYRDAWPDAQPVERMVMRGPWDDEIPPRGPTGHPVTALAEILSDLDPQLNEAGDQLRLPIHVGKTIEVELTYRRDGINASAPYLAVYLRTRTRDGSMVTSQYRDALAAPYLAEATVRAAVMKHRMAAAWAATQ
jgi:hypothetical protein